MIFAEMSETSKDVDIGDGGFDKQHVIHNELLQLFFANKHGAPCSNIHVFRRSFETGGILVRNEGLLNRFLWSKKMLFLSQKKSRFKINVSMTKIIWSMHSFWLKLILYIRYPLFHELTNEERLFSHNCDEITTTRQYFLFLRSPFERYFPAGHPKRDIWEG